jgi:outer membrane protein OmpA-like peptidoglycan-associated protein
VPATHRKTAWLSSLVLGLATCLVACGAHKPSALEQASERLPDNPAPETPPPPPYQHLTAGRAAPASAARTSTSLPRAPSPSAPQAVKDARASAPASEPPESESGRFETGRVSFDGERIRLLSRVEFDKNHRPTSPEARAVLDDVARLLAVRPGITRVEIQAHRHARMKTGGKRITSRRADAVKRYLVDKGVDASRLVANGYEDRVPIDTNRTEEGRTANTRVEFVVLELAK